jgi:hypothetical protein
MLMHMRFRYRLKCGIKAVAAIGKVRESSADFRRQSWQSLEQYLESW